MPPLGKKPPAPASGQGSGRGAAGRKPREVQAAQAVISEAMSSVSRLQGQLSNLEKEQELKGKRDIGSKAKATDSTKGGAPTQAAQAPGAGSDDGWD